MKLFKHLVPSMLSTGSLVFNAKSLLLQVDVWSLGITCVELGKISLIYS